MIKNHTDLLNALIAKYNLKSYLEIGVQNSANNFDKIKCKYKFGVDPDVKNNIQIYTGTSDEYFVMNKFQYELIFIDGLHHADQVQRDFENSLRCLSDNGFIVIHDVLPENEAGTLVPRQTKVWWGDVYKFAMGMRRYKNIKFVTYNIDNGCMVVTKRSEIYPEIMFGESWEDYLQFRDIAMNVTDDITI